MKNLFFLLIAALAFVACEQNPDLDKLDNEYLVVTNYDAKASFSSFNSYYMPDSILLITDKKDDTYWTSESNSSAAQILSTFKQDMSKIYTEAPDKTQADLGLQVSYIASTYYLTSWNDNPWWYGYPGYWSYSYWGGWGGWYYPYSITFEYSLGSIIAELVNLNSDASSTSKKLQVVWSCDISGLLNYKGELNLNKTLTGINQAFTQSPYLK